MSLRSRLFAALYDLITRGAEPHLAPLRRRTAGAAHGDVLEIGAGTGANLPYYADDARLTVLEPNPGMAARLRKKAARVGQPVDVRLHPGEAAPFPDASFDAVVATLVLCSVADQERFLAEVRRLLRRGGSFYFVEHVVSPDPSVRRWQRRLGPIWSRLADGCTLDRDTAAAIRGADFAEVQIETAELGIAPPITRQLIVGRARA